MASNGVAANLLMLGIVATGLLSLTGLEHEAWPTLPFNQVEVSVAYPGATPQEVEEAIVVKIEEQVNSLDDVRTVRSVAAEGMASVRVELRQGTDINGAIDDIKAAVDGIQSFPASAERPVFREMTNRQSVMRLVVHGNVSERSLKELAYHVEDQLVALPEVSLVETTGVRNYELSIEVPLHQLRALGITLPEVADAIRRSTLNLSAGRIETSESIVRVLSLGQRYDQHDFEDVVVLARTDGTVVRLGDIAEVRDGFEDTGIVVRHGDSPAAFVEISRADGEDVAAVVAAVKDHLENTIVPSLPAGTGITIWNDDSELFAERLDLLIKNGSLGLLLVLGALSLFLEIRLAVWVAVGLVVSGVGALTVLLALDLPINSFSLFAFVLAIGIVVDDAIVVAEHIHHERLAGAPGVVAAIRGARRIKGPLIFAVLTSVAAFAPLLALPGGIGEIMGPMPVVLISMLLISLVESLLVLPNHLSHLRRNGRVATNPVVRSVQSIQAGVTRGLKAFTEGPLHRCLVFATERPGVALAGATGVLIMCVSLLPAGIVETNFADEVESDFVTVSLEMPAGTPAQQTHEVATRIEEAGHRAIARLSQARPADAPTLLQGTTVTIGLGARQQGGGLVAAPTLNPQSNIATIDFKLLNLGDREIPTDSVLAAWREEVGYLPEARSIGYTGEVLSLGNPVEVTILHPDAERLEGMAAAVVDSLRRMDGVFDVRSDHTQAVREVQLKTKPEAGTLGLTQESIAAQARAAFFGEEALRVQRGREEVRVYVRLPEGDRDAITDVARYRIRTPQGFEVPLDAVANIDVGTSATSIRRRDGQRVVTVTADLDPSVTSTNQVTAFLQNTVLASVAEANPGMTFAFGGEAQQQFESFEALQRGFILAMIAIFALLAIPLRSYTKPAIIMVVIPFGLIGAILGHVILGVSFTFTSAMGFLGLSGVVVNDSLVMIDFIDQQRRQGSSVTESVIEGAKGRFRPIMLTSVTTFLGFTPLILEQAVQARFLVRFAASMGFGILITTAVLMMVVPALYCIHLRLAASRD